MLTFNVTPGVPWRPIPRLLVIFFSFLFFFNPTDPTSVNAFDAKRKKKGMVLIKQEIITREVIIEVDEFFVKRG